jgi:hypothetical protein
MAFPAGHVVGAGYPLAFFIPANALAGLNNLAGYLMAKDKRHPVDAVPLHDIRAAQAAGPDPNQ